VLVLLLVFIVIKVEMLLLCYRAERLMADMHKIRLYQSSWADAQELMRRWGAWGNYDGSCTAASCRYTIRLADDSGAVSCLFASNPVQWLLRGKQYWLASTLGWRNPRLFIGFTVQDGTIWRTTATIAVYVPPKVWDSDDWGYDLLVGTKSRQRLSRTKSDWWIMGSEDELAEHPYYKAGRPSGCKICEEAVVTYSTRTPPAEIERLTSFNFSCFVQLISCKELEQLLPAAKEWHLYHDDELYAIEQQHKWDKPKGCDIPLWALGRDRTDVMVVDAVATSMKPGWNGPYEVDRVRIISSLKGELLWQVGREIEMAPFSGESNMPPAQAAEHMTPGRRYVVIPNEDYDGNPMINSDENVVVLGRCGVHDDTQEVRRELEKGFAQNDTLTGPELR